MTDSNVLKCVNITVLIFAVGVFMFNCISPPAEKVESTPVVPKIVQERVKTKADILLEEANKKKAKDLALEAEILTYCSDRDFAFRKNYPETKLCIENYGKAKVLVKKIVKGIN
jgi:hypothetical protein